MDPVTFALLCALIVGLILAAPALYQNWRGNHPKKP